MERRWAAEAAGGGKCGAKRSTLRGATMFFGSFEHALDDKGRIIMPSRFRSALEEGVVMTRWLEQCVAVYPRSEFKKMAERIQGLPEGNLEKREFTRVLFGLSYEGVPDRQGRLTGPPKLREIAGLDREVEVVGMMNRVEIWDRERWEESTRDGLERFEQTAEKLSELGF